MKRRRRPTHGLGISAAAARKLPDKAAIWHSCLRDVYGWPEHAIIDINYLGRTVMGRYIVTLNPSGTPKSVRDASAANLKLYRRHRDEAFCCAGDARYFVATMTHGELRAEMRRLQHVHTAARGNGKKCVEARMVAIDEVLEGRGLTGASRRRSR